MRFGVFYELQMPKPWSADHEHRIFKEALEQIEVADREGIDCAWATEHHFLEEYAHCSAPEILLAAAASRTKRIRLGHGIRHVIAKTNHPARVAEMLGALDLVSDGRVEFGFGEGSSRLELGGFDIREADKRPMALEAAEQIANMMAMSPYPGYEGASFSFPCRNVLPKPLQKPHPPMWMACTNRETIRVAATLGVGALAFSFLEPEETKKWVDIYYETIKSDKCMPIGHAVNANIALVSGFSLHHNREEAIRRGQEGFEFFGYAIRAMRTQDFRPGLSRLWELFQERKSGERELKLGLDVMTAAPGIGTPSEMREHIREYSKLGVDQMIFLQQAGNARHEHICESLELFGCEVLPEFAAVREEADRRKRGELAPYVEAAMERKKWMPALTPETTPIVEALARDLEGKVTTT